MKTTSKKKPETKRIIISTIAGVSIIWLVILTITVGFFHSIYQSQFMDDSKAISQNTIDINQLKTCYERGIKPCTVESINAAN